MTGNTAVVVRSILRWRIELFLLGLGLSGCGHKTDQSINSRTAQGPSAAHVCGSESTGPRYVSGGLGRQKVLIDDLDCDGQVDTVSLGPLRDSSAAGLRVILDHVRLELPLANANDAMIIGSARLSPVLPRAILLVEADESVVLQTVVILVRHDSLKLAPFSPKLDLYVFDPMTYPACQLDSLVPRFASEGDSVTLVDAPYTAGSLASANLDCANEHRMLWKLDGDIMRATSRPIGAVISKGQSPTD